MRSCNELSTPFFFLASGDGATRLALGRDGVAVGRGVDFGDGEGEGVGEGEGEGEDEGEGDGEGGIKISSGVDVAAGAGVAVEAVLEMDSSGLTLVSCGSGVFSAGASGAADTGGGDGEDLGGSALRVKCCSLSRCFCARCLSDSANSGGTRRDGAAPPAQRLVRMPSVKNACAVFPLVWTLTAPSSFPRTIFP